MAGWCLACRRREPDLLLSHGTWEDVSRYCRRECLGGERECPERAEPVRA